MDYDGLRPDIVQMLGGWSEVMRVLKASEKLLEDTLGGDEESVARALDKAHTADKRQTLEGYSGEILLVGINYDKENVDKPHSCVIEKL